jgi:hypothetical protein
MNDRTTSTMIVVVAAAIMAAVLWPTQGHSGPTSKLILESNLRSVAGFILNYPARNQGVLPNPNKWLEAGITDVYPEPAFGDNDQDDIWMCPIPWDDRRLPDDLTPYQLGQIPMLHNKVDLNPDGTSVAFWDGSVRLLGNEEFAAMVNVEDSVCLGCQFPVPEFLQGQEP